MTRERIREGSLARVVIVIMVLASLAGPGPTARSQSSRPAAPAAPPTSRPADAGGSRPTERIGRMPPVERPTPPAAPAPDDSVDQAVNRLENALGGISAFDAMTTLRLTFAVSVRDTVRTSRTHWWNRVTGDYRVQGRGRDGKEYIVLFNVNTRQGKVAVDGRTLAGDELTTWLDRGYGLFINDTYWLLMPFKLRDPGVHRTAAGRVDIDGRACDRLQVTFDRVGLTPGDTYWVYIDRQTGAMPRWGFLLEGDRDKPGATETLWDWTGWKASGGLKLATRRIRRNDPDRTEIRFSDLDVNGTLPADAFSALAPITVTGERR